MNKKNQASNATTPAAKAAPAPKGPIRSVQEQAKQKVRPTTVIAQNARSKVVARDARAIENRIEKMSAGAVLHPGALTSSGRRHGYLERTAIRMTESGLCHTYKGTERLGQIRVPVDTIEGDILDVVQLNPTAFGAILPQFAKPFAKFLFTKVDFEEVPELAQVNTQAQGSVYFGLNFDPDAELPIGPGGPNSVATWAPNDSVLALKDVREKWLHARLDQASQIPLFVGRNGDEKFESQAQMVCLAGTNLNTNGSAVLSAGEWFIHYTVDLYQLNTTPSDTAKSVTYGHVDSIKNASNGILDLNANGFTYIGDGDTVIAEDYQSGISFVLPANGTYVVETLTLCETVGATIAGGKLQYFEVAGLKPPVGVDSSCFMKANINNTTGDCDPYLDIRGTCGYGQWHASNGDPVVAGAAYPMVIRSYTFSGPQGTPLAISLPTYTSGGSGQNMNLWISFTRLDNVFHVDGLLPVRTTFNTTLSFADIRTRFHLRKELKAEAEITAELKLSIVEYIIANRSKLDEGCLSVIIDKCQLPIEKRTTTTMILPALAAVASWAVATFGPVLAEKACKWISRKLEGK